MCLQWNCAYTKFTCNEYFPHQNSVRLIISCQFPVLYLKALHPMYCSVLTTLEGAERRQVNIYERLTKHMEYGLFMSQPVGPVWLIDSQKMGFMQGECLKAGNYLLCININGPKCSLFKQCFPSKCVCVCLVPPWILKCCVMWTASQRMYW